jgi:tetratricopeptide (TPR) repeat protein
MFQGRSQAAMEAGRKIARGIEPPMIAGPFSETIQHLMSQPLYVMVRFGRWNDVLAEPKPLDEYAYINAIWHYARGMAFSHTGKPRQARAELATVEKAAASPAMKDKMVGFAPAPAVLGIAADVLGAEIDAARGDRPSALSRLERAVRVQDGFLYNEPPDWYFPVRHYLGAALLEDGRAAEAETVYWQDLARNPANGYALFGLQKAQAAQGKTAAASATGEQLRRAWQQADVTLASSRF